ncbi:MAG TPA: Gfo/Idh/MocA family oxidoreductase, partial [Solirubrobacterales bacterium]|nr:Gfo/Idh/MocA family oxidoreductase [Solirubrobacterales bacterium]
MLKVAIVGCGYIAQAEHIPNWRQTPGAEIVALVDERADLAAEVGGAFGLPTFASLSQALERADIDAVHVSTSLPSHVPLAVQAASAGKHVLVEKPLADDAESGAAAVAAA